MIHRLRCWYTCECMFEYRVWLSSLCCSGKHKNLFDTWSHTITTFSLPEWPKRLACTSTNELHRSLTTVSVTETKQPTIHTFGPEISLASSQEQASAQELHTSQPVNSIYSVCGVWECGPSLCGAAWHRATGRSRWLPSWRCRFVRLSLARASKGALWLAPQTKWNSLGSPPLSCLLKWAAPLGGTEEEE